VITVGVSEARNKLSALLDRVERGKTAMITRRGVPVARLVPDSAGVDPSKYEPRCSDCGTVHRNCRPNRSIGAI
jgi:prevent-host-death family protein